jgi:hypothetical protein
MDDPVDSPQSGRPSSSAAFAAELLGTLQARTQSAEHNRPTLIAWSLRMPQGIHRQLRRAAKKHDVGMTDIVVEGLRRILPALLSEEELKGAEDR